MSDNENEYDLQDSFIASESDDGHESESLEEEPSYNTDTESDSDYEPDEDWEGLYFREKLAHQGTKQAYQDLLKDHLQLRENISCLSRS